MPSSRRSTPRPRRRTSSAASAPASTSTNAIEARARTSTGIRSASATSKMTCSTPLTAARGQCAHAALRRARAARVRSSISAPVPARPRVTSTPHAAVGIPGPPLAARGRCRCAPLACGPPAAAGPRWRRPAACPRPRGRRARAPAARGVRAQRPRGRGPARGRPRPCRRTCRSPPPAAVPLLGAPASSAGAAALAVGALRGRARPGRG